VNSRRLTTPFDIHKTLLSLLDFEPDTQTSMNPIERGLNLLNEVPTSRTCEEAGILPHMYLQIEHHLVLFVPSTDNLRMYLHVSHIQQDYYRHLVFS
jgi:hypothetical protein